MIDARQIEVPDEMVVETLRGMTAGERLAVANGMWVAARNAVEQIIRSEHPRWDEQQVQQEIVRRMLRGPV